MMKSTRTFVILLAAVSLTFSAPSLWAEDWAMPDGQVYHEVSILKIEPDAVTILHHDGGGRIPLSKLPPELQQRFHYDPVEAQAAAQARVQANAQRAEAERMANAALVAQNADTSTTSSGSGSASPPTTPRHYSMDSLAESASTLRAPPSPDHYSMDSLVESASTLRAPPSPRHHTMDELF